MAKEVERTKPGSKNDWRVTYDTGSKKWTNDRPGDGEGDPDAVREIFSDLTVKRGLKRLERAVNAFMRGKGTKAIQEAVEALEQHAGKDNARTVIRKVYSIEKMELEVTKSDVQKKIVEGLDVAKKHLNRDRKARTVTAYIKGVPPTEAHRAALDRLRSFWEATNWKTYVSFENATDITFKNEPDYQSVRMVLYTGQNEYPINVHVEPDKPIEAWYMGAYFGTRLQRPTEDWTRGNDLPDGDFTFELWQEILNSITQCELLDITEYVGDGYQNPLGAYNEKAVASELVYIARSILNERVQDNWLP